MPVRFVCRSCLCEWWAPPGNGCPNCGVAAECTPDSIVWSIGAVPGTRISISGHLLNGERLHSILAMGVTVFVDVAGSYDYIWRPDLAQLRAAGINYTMVDSVEDTNIDLPDFAFDAVATALEAVRSGRHRALVFCAAGLKRSPHLVYGVLRRWGHSEGEAWAMVSAARPFTEPYEPYIRAAERWLATASRASPGLGEKGAWPIVGSR